MSSKPEDIFTIDDMKAWRRAQSIEGLPSSRDDFFRVNNYCDMCHGRKGSFSLAIWVPCAKCRGSGTYQEMVAELERKLSEALGWVDTQRGLLSTYYLETERLLACGEIVSAEDMREFRDGIEATQHETREFMDMKEE